MVSIRHILIALVAIIALQLLTCEGRKLLGTDPGINALSPSLYFVVLKYSNNSTSCADSALIPSDSNYFKVRKTKAMVVLKSQALSSLVLFDI